MDISYALVSSLALFVVNLPLTYMLEKVEAPWRDRVILLSLFNATLLFVWWGVRTWIL